MRVNDKTKEQLIEELAEMRQRIAELEKLETEHKKAEKVLHESEERYRAVVEDQTEIICRFYPDGIYIFVNDLYCRFFGKSKEELIGRKWFPDAHVDDLEMIKSKLLTMTPSNPVVMIENRVFSGDRVLRWMQFVNRGFYGQHGNLLEIQSVGRDITERKKMEGELQKTKYELEDRVKARTSELKLTVERLQDEIDERKQIEEVLVKSELWMNSIYDSLEEAVLVVTPDRLLRNVNKATEIIFGYSRNELLEKSTEILHIDHEHYLEFGKRIKDAFDRREPANFEFEVKRKNGEVFPTEHTVSLLKDKSGESIGIVSVVKDITERKQTEQSLRESEQRFRTLVEQSPVSTVIFNHDGTVMQVNQAWEKLWGVKLSDLQENNYNTLTDMQLEKLGILKYIKKAFAGQATLIPAQEYDAKDTLGKGAKRWVHARIYPVMSKNGNLRNVVLMHEDITNQKKAEESLKKANREIEAWSRELEKRVNEKTEELKNSQAQLIQSEKLSAMGQMAGGLAHELNSPLGGLLPMLEKYRNEAEKDSKEYNELSLMHKACEHMAKIVRDFSSFSRESKGEFSELNVNEVIDDTLSFIASRIKQKGIQITKEYEDTLPKVDGEKTELQQVVLNMITNALDAMTDRGELTIRTDITKDKNNVIMEFIDNGAGIEKEYLSKLFDPFYTTKRPGKGTGLGLSVSYKIIEKHGGKLSVESEPGKGTKFTIYLPAVKSNNT